MILLPGSGHGLLLGSVPTNSWKGTGLTFVLLWLHRPRLALLCWSTAPVHMTTHHLMRIHCLEKELTACLDISPAASLCHRHLLCVIDLTFAVTSVSDMNALAQHCAVLVVAEQGGLRHCHGP